MKKYVDRGEPLQGINRTLRDSRTPYSLVRSIDNFSLPDSKLKRRSGFLQSGVGRIQGNWLCKQTGSTVVSRVGEPHAGSKSQIYKTPLSYGIIHYHDDFKLTLSSSWTREMFVRLGDKEDLVINPYTRAGYFTGTNSFDGVLRTPGVYILDQTLLANAVSFDTGTIASGDGVTDMDTDHSSSGDESYHSVALPTMAISYTESAINVEMGVIEKTASGVSTQAGVYWPREINLSYSFAGGSYTVGDQYHICVRYNVSNTTLELLIDGTVQDSYVFGDPGKAETTNYALIGEYDIINEQTYATGLGRDIVVLNECTARGSYSVTNKIQTYMNQPQTFYQSYNSSLTDPDAPAMPWACSPPRGTAIRALRFWSDLRSDVEVAAFDRQDDVSSESNLLGNWVCDDGSGVVLNDGGSTGSNADLVLCHSYPAYTNDSGLLHGLGLRLVDGQHIIFSTTELSNKYIQDSALPMISTFGYDPQETSNEQQNPSTPSDPHGYYLTNSGFNDIDRIKSQHDVTVQIQFRVPTQFQLEYNLASTSGTLLTDRLYDDYYLKNAGTPRETRRSMQGAASFNTTMLGCAVRDGGYYKTESWGPDGRSAQARPGTCVDTAANSGNTAWVYADGDSAFTRAYDMTLFSVEGHGEDEADESDNFGSRVRVPLMRGLLTPDGLLALEVLCAGDNNHEIIKEMGTNFYPGVGQATPVLHRVLGETTLTAGNVYTATFVKRATYNAESGRPGVVIDNAPNGQQFEIWLHDITSGGTATMEYSSTPYKREILHRAISTFTRNGTSPETWNATLFAAHGLATGEAIKCEFRGAKSSTYPLEGWCSTYDCEVVNSTTLKYKFATLTTGTLTSGGSGMFAVIDGALRSSFARHKPIYDVIVGASKVNDSFDRSLSMPKDYGREVPVINGPWLVPQRFMSPYEDQPANLHVGFFRLWAGVALSGEEIHEFGDASLSTKRYSPHLVINAEIEENAGNRILNKTRYPGFLKTGYKSWGTPPSSEFEENSDFSIGPYAYQSWVPGAFMMEDCLGYIAMNDSDTSYYSGDDVECNGLTPFQTTLTQSYGLLAVFNDSLTIDGSLDGSYSSVFLSGHGLLNEFAPSARWRGTSIGDRTILTSDGGLPKVFNGKTATVAGFKDWTGGKPTIIAVADSTASLGDDTDDLYYGIRIVYNAEEYSIQHMSETYVFKVGNSGTRSRIDIFDIPPHYDPRVTSIQIYRSRGQLTRDLAFSATMFPIRSGALPNTYHSKVSVRDADSTLFPAPLDRARTEIPICRYSASMNGRLYLAGSIAIPDAVYFSVAGNPETFDVLEQVIILEQGSGDKITGLVSMFGVLFVFKANSVWRVEEIGGAQHQQNQIASVGPVSEDSIEVFTIPQSGRTAIFFWSQYGPYILDGSVLQYVGVGIEDEDRVSGEFAWLDPASVLTLHDIKNKEIICFYKKDGAPLSEAEDRRSEAIVYNYRFQIWYRYTGVFATAALATSFTGNSYVPSLGTSAVGINAQYDNITVALVGGYNGRIYKWGDDDYDGAPGGTAVATRTISSVSGLVYTLDASIGSVHDFKRLKATVRQRRTGEWHTYEIDDNTATTITVVDTDDAPSWTPAPGDSVYICRAPASVVFPWDDMGIPLFDKSILELITWHNQDFFFKFSKDWDSTDHLELDSSKSHKVWYGLDAPSVVNGRSRTRIDKLCEAVKLELVSFEVGSSFDAFAYHIDYTDGAH